MGRGGIGSLGKWDPETPDLGWGNAYGAGGQGGGWPKGSRRRRTIKHTRSDGSLAANALSWGVGNFLPPGGGGGVGVGRGDVAEADRLTGSGKVGKGVSERSSPPGRWDP